MRAAHVVEIVTPKKIVLNGLWFGPARPKRAIVWVHGMFSSAFSMRHIIDLLVDKETAVLAFNNRGFETAAEVKRLVGKKREYVRAGTAQEIFTDSIDDIDGAINLARKSGAKQLYLAGHSTGCQKSVYWAYKKGRGVQGLILLGALSDYVGARSDKRYEKTLEIAKKMIQEGRAHELLPADSYWHYSDAQRFVSLYTPDSIEQSIFPYFDESRKSDALYSVKVPILLIYAADDEYSDRPAAEMVRWFEAHARCVLTPFVAKRTGHSFRGAEKPIAKTIKSWLVKKK